MKTAGPVLAFLSVLIVCLVFVFVWAGTERVQFGRVAMQDDLPVAEVDSSLRSTMSPGDEPSATINSPHPAAAHAQSKGPSGGGANFILWINVSGLRADYLEQTETPFLDSMAKSGSFTAALQPPFPSLHYPSLLCQATGRPVREHGIVSDKLRDPASGKVIANPTDLSLLKAEPIWTTAKRQGVGVLVHQWPFSQKQPPEHAADIFLPEINFTSSAEERLNAVLEAWSGHAKEPKIRLVMVSLVDLEVAARSYGARAKETYEALEKLDKTLASFRDRVREKWPKLRAAEGDELHIFVTTDRGLVDVKKVINFGALMGDLAQQVEYATSDSIAQLWFKKEALGADPKSFEETFDGELKSRIYWRPYNAQEDLPKGWNLSKGPLIGDRVLMLKSGYGFTDKTGSEPVFDPAETGGPLCVAGHPVVDQPRVVGQAFFAKLEGTSYGSDLGSVDGTQLYATVCDLLAIEPASGVRARALNVR